LPKNTTPRDKISPFSSSGIAEITSKQQRLEPMLFQHAIAVVHISEYFEHGQVVCDVTKLRERYVSITAFKMDMVSQLDVVSQCPQMLLMGQCQSEIPCCDQCTRNGTSLASAGKQLQ